MAAKLLIEEQTGVDLTPIPPPKGSGLLPKPMNRESQLRFVAVLLFLMTVAAVVFAGFNFQKEREFAVPDDGVWWVEHNGRLVADGLESSGPGAKSGIKIGDQLNSVNGDRKSTRLNSSHQIISYAVFCLKKKKNNHEAYNLQ